MEAQLITQGTLQTREGRSLPLERTEVRGSVTGAVADITVRQVFRNDIEVPIEAVYLFPLPHEASVYRLQFRIADRVVQGVVKEKAEARRVYEQARAEGRAATLLEEEKPALFTLSVANVAPGVTIEVELGYQEVLAYDDGRWRFVFPMVAPERYQDTPAHGSVGLPRRATRTRAPDVSVELMVRGDGEVEGLRSPSHKIHLRHTDDGVPIASLDAGEALPNKDFVLTWRAGDVGVRPWLRFERDEGRPGTFLLMLTPSVPRTHTEGVGGDGDAKAVRCGNCGGVIRDLSAIKEIPGLGPVIPCAFCGAILAPGTEVITRATRPRDLLILVDRSASMRGAMPAAARAVRALLDGMGPGDGAQLMAFDHDRLAFDGDGERFAVISPELTQMAERFMATLTPRGGTELEEALTRASKAPAREGRTRVVVLITDAAVGNEGRLLRRVPELLGASTRLFVLGLGPAVDRRLVERLARAGGGASDVALPGDTDPEVFTRFARKVREGGAVLTNVTLYWEGAEMVEVYPKRVPDLHGGEPLKVFGRFTHTGMTKLIITAATAEGKPYRQEVEVGLPASTTRKPGITRLWARQRVEDLATRAAAGATDAGDLRAEGTALALAHSLVGPFTSLVAEDLEVSVQKRKVRKTRLLVSSVNVPMTGLTIDRPRVTIGRGSGADLQLTDNNVSRMHCELTLTDDAWELRDLNSVNGTWVNGASVRQGRIEPGSTLKVGDTTLRFEFADGFFETLPTKRVDVPQMPVDRDAPEAEGGGGPSVGEKAAKWRARTAARAESAAAMTDELLADEESEDEVMERGLDLSVPHAAAPRAAAPAPRAFGPIGASRGGGTMFGAAPMPSPPGGPPPGASMPAPMSAPMPAPGAPSPSFGAAPPSAAYAPPPAAAAPVMIGAMAGPPAASMGPLPAKRGGILSRIVDAFTGSSDGAEPFAPPVDAAPSPPPSSPKPPPPTPPAMPPMMMPPPNLMAPPPPTNLPPPPRPVASPHLQLCDRCGHMSPMSVATCLTCGVSFNAPQGARDSLSQKGFVASEPYSDEELTWFRARNRGELDLVFLVDETGSMGSYIAQVRQHLLALVEELKASPLCRMLRVGVVSYRDHPPQDRTYASKVLPLTDDIETVRRAVEKLTASGGGDGPESVTDGLYDLVRLDWRPSAARAVVWFGDAPPHGVEPHGDAFPEGCPCGHHWFTQAESCREMGVTVYAIGCLPGIRSFKGAEAVFQQVARTTHGVYLPLREASLLVPMIVGAASAELDRQRVDEHVSDLVTEAGASFVDTTDVERVSWLSRALTAKGVRLRDMQLDEGTNAAPLRFRAVVPADVEASLQRLRYQGRVSA
jgi:pSer/pThr/pTyr-binding forkhead associated (FHA) protein/Mg-chelatase subunit ChlD